MKIKGCGFFAFSICSWRRGLKRPESLCEQKICGHLRRPGSHQKSRCQTSTLWKPCWCFAGNFSSWGRVFERWTTSFQSLVATEVKIGPAPSSNWGEKWKSKWCSRGLLSLLGRLCYVFQVQSELLQIVKGILKLTWNIFVTTFVPHHHHSPSPNRSGAGDHQVATGAVRAVLESHSQSPESKLAITCNTPVHIDPLKLLLHLLQL